MSTLPANPLAAPGARQRIVDMLARGMTDQQMADALGVNIHTFRAWKRHYGLTSLRRHRRRPAARARTDAKLAVASTPSSNPLAAADARQRIVAMLEQGMTDAQMAEAFGAKARTFRWWKRRYGLTKESPPRSNPLAAPDARQRIVAMLEQGMNDAQMAEAFGVKARTFRWWKRRYGLTQEWVMTHPGARDRLEALLEQGNSDAKCAQKLGVSVSTITAWKRKWRLSSSWQVNQPGVRERLEGLLAQGATYAQCALALKVSEGTVYNWARKWGLTTPRVMAMPGVRQRVELLAAQGIAVREIAHEVGATQGAVYLALRRWGLTTPSQRRSA